MHVRTNIFENNRDDTQSYSLVRVGCTNKRCFNLFI